MAVDCLVIGGGVIGLTTAWRLAQQGFSVRVCDQGTPGREASWAGAGILPPGYPGSLNDPLTQLTARTCELWPILTEELRELTGQDNQFQRCGGLELSVGTGADLQAYRDQWAAIGARTEWLEPQEICDLEPAFSGAEAGFLLPDLCQVRNPRHLQALLRACELAGVVVSSDCPVKEWGSQGGRITSAITPREEIVAGQFVVTAGAWSPLLLAQVGVTTEIVPVRGQIVQLAPSSIQINRVIEREKRYIVPRRDGRILIGATEEWAGYDKQNTDEAIAGLMEFGSAICPALRSATIENSWAGLRPCAVRNRPFIGRVPGRENLIVATGHFRSGLHLSPATAELVVELVHQRNLPDPFSAFAF
ncbi:MAG: glycine oxidase ThiO [Planctomycetaceae bacterium]